MKSEQQLLTELVLKHSGVNIDGMRIDEALAQVRHTIIYLAAVARAGNNLAVALERLAESEAVEDGIAGYLKEVSRAVGERTAAMGMRELQEGACRVDVG